MDRYIVKKDGVVQFRKGAFIKLIENRDGYYQFKLCKDGKMHTVRVHQIVGLHFLSVPDNNISKYEINHKDYNRKNNCADNLGWLTHRDNVKHSAINGRYKIRNINGSNNPNYGNHALSEFYRNNPDIAKEKAGRPKEKNGRAVRIALYDEKMNYINTFDWIGGCAEYLIKNNLTKAKIDSIRANILIAINKNKKYLKHYYKKIA